jgi:two-component system chemotaxis sensor kinase CheA
MVTQNAELRGLQLDNFHKETRHLRKIIGNLRQTIMSMRLVPLGNTFFKQNRIVRDMCRQLGKEVTLEIVGEDTEVDKKIIEHIADPIMHIIRNSSIDHGVEMPDEREKKGKPRKAHVLLEAKNAGGDVLIIIQDDGKGIDTERVLKKAKENGLTTKPDNEYTDKEIQQFIFLPGFSTNEQVTNYSGRGVGMDVVFKNLEICGGTALVDSTPGVGTTFTLKIPLTLAIIEGMSVRVAGAQYTIPIANIIKSFKATPDKLFTDPNGNEMITERDEIYNIVRLHEFFGIEGAITNIVDGTLMELENGDQRICLLVDELLGQQQAVVKPMPKYFKRVRGINGCTLLGTGDVSIIVDVPGFFDN